jgi:hypothetical protein
MPEPIRETDTKRCSRCRVVKPLSEFHRSKHNRSGDGHRSACKDCRWKQPQLIPDQSEEAIEAAADPMPKPRPGDSGPGLNYPMPEPVPEPSGDESEDRRWWPKPIEVENPPMPRRLREVIEEEKRRSRYG